MMRGNFLIQEHSHTLLYEEGERIQDTGDDIVIVIDPGHGGENLGAETGKIYEKYMTMATAEAMRDRLSGYDGVTVYMTREEDTDLSLADRAEFASSVSADYLFSIHYNASADHNAWGTEIWVPLEPPYNAYGFQFGSVWLSEMERFGVFSRGVKTRTGKAGNYYGILRHCTKKGSLPRYLNIAMLIRKAACVMMRQSIRQWERLMLKRWQYIWDWRKVLVFLRQKLTNRLHRHSI